MIRPILSLAFALTLGLSLGASASAAHDGDAKPCCTPGTKDACCPKDTKDDCCKGKDCCKAEGDRCCHAAKKKAA